MSDGRLLVRTKTSTQTEKLLKARMFGDMECVVEREQRLNQSRGTIHAVDLIDLSEQLKQGDVGLRSLKEQIDTGTSAGELYFHIMSALAQFERSLIKERTSAGLAAARARGRKGGRPRALTDAQVAAARAMLSDPKISVDEVAACLGASRATIYRALPVGGRTALLTTDRTT